MVHTQGRKTVSFQCSIWQASCRTKDSRASFFAVFHKSTWTHGTSKHSLMGTVISPDVSTFSEALDTLVESFTISQQLADAVLASGLWNTSDEFSPCECVVIGEVRKSKSDSFSLDNASQSVDTDHFLTCDGVAWTGAAATHKVFPEMYVLMTLGKPIDSDVLIGYHP